MPDGQPCQAWRAKPLYWSTLAYQRAFWATDGAHRRLVENRQGLTVPLLRRSGDEYRVNRWIPVADKSPIPAEDRLGIEDDPSARLYLRLLHEAQAHWPASGAVARATVCEAVVMEAKRHGVSTSTLASATTKFMWFLRPDGWTVFDRLACQGMGIAPDKGTAAQRMLEFYARLECAGFEALAAEMDDEIGRSLLAGLPATRILDTLFMARAGGGSDQLGVDRLAAFLALLPPLMRDALHTLAETLQAQFGPHPLARHDHKAAA